MSRAYLRVDPNLMDRKGDYPDGAFRAFVEILCHAVQQTPRGRFRNAKLLRVLLDKRARWVPFLIAKQDIRVLESGQIYVEGWDEWQEGDWTVSERVARIRARQRVSSTVTSPVTGFVSDSVSTPYSGGGGGGNSGGGAPFANGDATTKRSTKRPSRPGSHDGQHRDCIVCDQVRATPSIDEQMDRSFDHCAECQVRRGAHSTTEHPFAERKRATA